MPAYLIANVKVNDDSWIPDYAANVHDIVHKHGGKYLARSGNIAPVEGEVTENIIVVIEFPDTDAARALTDDPDYAPFAAARQAGTDSRVVIIDDTDAAGSIPYLTAGG